MAAVRAMDDDRLPWLDADPPRRGRGGRMWPILLLILGALIVAALSFWLGRTTVDEPAPPAPQLTRPSPPAEPRAEPARRQPSAAVPAPAAEPVRLSPPPEVQPPPRPASEAPKASKRVSAPKPKAAAPRQSRAKPNRAASRTAKAPARRTSARRRSGYWPTPAAAVKLGRVIQIGAYSNARRADAAWVSALRRYPQMRGLPKIMSAYRASNGKLYHRVQIITTAPAQSQWLCRRLRADGRGCVVLG